MPEVQRVQYLLSELSAEIQVLQQRLDAALEHAATETGPQTHATTTQKGLTGEDSALQKRQSFPPVPEDQCDKPPGSHDVSFKKEVQKKACFARKVHEVPAPASFMNVLGAPPGEALAGNREVQAQAEAEMLQEGVLVCIQHISEEDSHDGMNKTGESPGEACHAWSIEITEKMNSGTLIDSDVPNACTKDSFEQPSDGSVAASIGIPAMTSGLAPSKQAKMSFGSPGDGQGLAAVTGGSSQISSKSPGDGVTLPGSLSMTSLESDAMSACTGSKLDGCKQSKVSMSSRRDQTSTLSVRSTQKSTVSTQPVRSSSMTNRWIPEHIMEMAMSHGGSLGVSVDNWRHKRQSRAEEREPSRMMQILIGSVYVVPPVVIVLNALTIGLSSEIHTNHIIWQIFESVWIAVYFLEFVAKLFLFGYVDYFCGSEKVWNLFDFTCLTLSLVDACLTFIFPIMNPGTGVASLMKLLRLLRLLRLVRALEFPIFAELKQMILGVVAGMRVFIWAVVLLFVIVFFGGVMVSNLMGEHEDELATLPMSMLTVFRCFTDGCVAFDGTPLAPRLVQKYGALFFFGYILSFMFVNFGVFNLIMAIFIDNIVTRTLKKKLHDIGISMPQTREFIRETLLTLIADDPSLMVDFDDLLMECPENVNRVSSKSFLSFRSSIGLQEADTINGLFTELQQREFCISRNTFELWLENPKMRHMLAKAEIDFSNHSDLFDALDVCSSGKLMLDDLVNGFLTMRGPITKSDIVSVRLKMCHLVDRVEENKHSLDLVMKAIADMNKTDG